MRWGLVFPAVTAVTAARISLFDGVKVGFQGANPCFQLYIR